MIRGWTRPLALLALVACTLPGCTAPNLAYEGGGLEGSANGDGTTTTESSASAATVVPPGTGDASAGVTTEATEGTTHHGTTTGSTSDDPPPASSSGEVELPRVLLVTQLGDRSLPLDETLATTLESLGLVVVPISDTAVTAADAEAVDLVVISETATAGEVGGKLRDVARPAVVLEGDIWNDMSMAPFGNAMFGTTIYIAASDHPIAAELSGEVAVLTMDPGSGVFGTLPPPSAQVIAHAFDAVGPIVVFAFESGVPMEGGFPAPAARVGLGFDVDGVGTSTANLTRAGVAMFTAAVQWALP